MLKLYKNVSWHFTDYKEKDYVETYFKVKDYYIIPNLIQKSLTCNPHKDKNKNELKLIFLSRISPKKNIVGALKILSKITDNWYQYNDLRLFFSLYVCFHMIFMLRGDLMSSFAYLVGNLLAIFFVPLILNRIICRRKRIES